MLIDHERQLHQTLLNLGLGESETIVLLLSHRLGASSIGQLAEESRMGRITVHEIVRRLIAKGLMLETYNKRRRLVYPAPADAVTKLLESKKSDLIQLEQATSQAVGLLRGIQTMSENLPTLRSYKGQEGIRTLKAELTADKSDIHILSDGQHFYDLIDNDFLEQTVTLRKKHKLNVQLLFPSGFDYFTFTQGMIRQQLDIKFFRQEPDTHGGIVIRGDKIAFCCYEGRYLTTSIVDNASIARMMRFVFAQTWSNN